MIKNEINAKITYNFDGYIVLYNEKGEPEYYDLKGNKIDGIINVEGQQ